MPAAKRSAKMKKSTKQKQDQKADQLWDVVRKKLNGPCHVQDSVTKECRKEKKDEPQDDTHRDASRGSAVTEGKEKKDAKSVGKGKIRLGARTIIPGLLSKDPQKREKALQQAFLPHVPKANPSMSPMKMEISKKQKKESTKPKGPRWTATSLLHYSAAKGLVLAQDRSADCRPSESWLKVQEAMDSFWDQKGQNVKINSSSRRRGTARTLKHSLGTERESKLQKTVGLEHPTVFEKSAGPRMKSVVSTPHVLVGITSQGASNETRMDAAEDGQTEDKKSKKKNGPRAGDDKKTSTNAFVSSQDAKIQPAPLTEPVPAASDEPPLLLPEPAERAEPEDYDPEVLSPTSSSSTVDSVHQHPKAKDCKLIYSSEYQCMVPDFRNMFQNVKFEYKVDLEGVRLDPDCRNKEMNSKKHAFKPNKSVPQLARHDPEWIRSCAPSNYDPGFEEIYFQDDGTRNLGVHNIIKKCLKEKMQLTVSRLLQMSKTKEEKLMTDNAIKRMLELPSLKPVSTPTQPERKRRRNEKIADMCFSDEESEGAKDNETDDEDFERVRRKLDEYDAHPDSPSKLLGKYLMEAERM